MMMNVATTLAPRTGCKPVGMKQPVGARQSPGFFFRDALPQLGQLVIAGLSSGCEVDLFGEADAERVIQGAQPDDGDHGMPGRVIRESAGVDTTGFALCQVIL